MRLVASAIVVLAGSVCLGLSGSSETSTVYARDANSSGAVILFLGGVCFAVEFIRTWNAEREAKS